MFEKMRLSKCAAFVGLVAFARAITIQEGFTPRSLMHLAKDDLTQAAATSTIGNATFEQFIDHEDASLGYFTQFYYYSDEWWSEGGPVIFFTPGEVNVTGYQSYASLNRTTGVLASEIGAAVIVMEHRYWGMSSPYDELTTENMKYLTLKNAIADFTNFAKNANLPFDPNGSSTADKAPWVMMGGSYSGALSAWTESTSPGTFWAYHASSAPVQAISDYWAYFYPIQEGMPQNCSTDISLVIDHIDSILATGTSTEKHDLKAMFGLGPLADADFGAALENGPWLWQGNQFYTNTGFFDFCDAVENVINSNSPIPDATGVGLEKALAGYASWFNGTFLPGWCAGYGYTDDEYDISCFDTYNASNPMFTDTSLSNTVDRQWEWMLCNEPFGYWQDGAPAGRPSIVSRTVNAEYWQRQCALFFPTAADGFTFASAHGKTEDDVNVYTQGWNLTNSTRLIWANGGYDPWREAGVSSDFRPGGMLQATPQAPVNIVPGGFHTSDLVTKNGEVNAGCKAVIDAEVAQLKAWVEEWPGSSKRRSSDSGGGKWKEWSA
jgi:hypothetical protein